MALYDPTRPHGTRSPARTWAETIPGTCLRLACLALLISGCAADPERPDPVTGGDGTGADGTTDDGTGTAPDGSIAVGDLPVQQQPRDEGEGLTCGSREFALDEIPVNVMVLLDGSDSMMAHWATAANAIVDMVNTTNNGNVQYGLHVFNSETDIGEIFGDSTNICGDAQHNVVDVAPNNGQNMVNAIGPQPPGGRSPLLNALQYYLDNDTMLEDPTATNYLVVLSDANDDCFGTLFAGNNDVTNAMKKVGVELLRKNIRVLPIGFNADGSAAQNPNGPPNMFPGTNEEVLVALTENGGTGLTMPFHADDPAELAQVLQVVAISLRPCRFGIPAVEGEGVNPFELTFEVNGYPAERDRSHQEGWDFVQGNVGEVQFYGQACADIQGEATIRTILGCQSNVCGTAATKVSTQPQAIHLLLDASSSMRGGLGDQVGVLCETIGFCEDVTKTPWGQATSALSGLVTSPINDDVQFGLQLFPSALGSGCEVLPNPEVEVAQGNQLEIVSNLVSNLPGAFNFTPLVDSYESIANRVASADPGMLANLADPNTVGAVLILSDGGDSCAQQGQGSSAQMTLDRLGAAALSLLQQGVRTYAIAFGGGGAGFGGAGGGLEAQMQLAQIALNGGTMDVITAPDSDVLVQRLEELSLEFATCDLNIGELDSSVDKDDVNLYLNGDAVPQDAGNAGEGWAWTNPERTKLELRGEVCENLKRGRLSDLVIEFGCEPIFLL